MQKKTLKHCLSSVSCQKKNWVELLIIDGYSTDRTMDIVRDFKESVDVIVSEVDKGITVRGIRASVWPQVNG